jgi:hypothetical protein
MFACTSTSNSHFFGHGQSYATSMAMALWLLDFPRVIRNETACAKPEEQE